MDKTTEYYNQNAQQYFDSTVSLDMTANCDRFLQLVRPGGCIVDVGAGSGRDMRYFKSKGHEAEGIDASAEMCRLASAYAEAPVVCVRIQDWVPQKRYAGIWANASLVHLKPDEIKAFLCRLPDILEEGGIAYVSLKTGIATGEDENGRYFTNMTEDWILGTVSGIAGLKTVDCWRTKDGMNRGDLEWINVLMASA